MKWRPAKELTHEVVKESWHLLLVDEYGYLWSAQNGTTWEGHEVISKSENWYIYEQVSFNEEWEIEYFAIIEKPWESTS